MTDQQMQITWAPIDDIRPYGQNPKHHSDESINAIAASIRSHGWKQVIAVNPQGVILAGEGRWLAAKRLGLERVPVVYFHDLDETGQRAYRLADNKTAELSSWIEAKLREEEAFLDGIDLTQFGFEESLPVSFIDDLLKEDFATASSHNRWFDVTFTFEVEHKEMIHNYIKEHGKEELADLILSHIMEGLQCRDAEAR